MNHDEQQLADKIKALQRERGYALAEYTQRYERYKLVKAAKDEAEIKLRALDDAINLMQQGQLELGDRK